MGERKAVAKIVQERYRRSEKKEKGRILDEFVKVTGYNRSYARSVLRGAGRGYGRRKKKGKERKAVQVGRARKREYDEGCQRVLVRVWEIMDFICGKRLAPVLGEMVEILVNFGELTCDAQILEKLRRISAATIDRMLAGERKKHQLRGRSRTRPGSLLKKQIPMRTFSEWDEGRPGFVEIDLVAHDGGAASGDYLQTLDVTDTYSGWTEVQAVKNKAQAWVFQALKDIRGRLPFELLGIDSDNGSEFINHQLYRYSQSEHLTFTRSRPYRKNDNCFVEQKNYSVVRRHVGYQRLEDEQQQAILNDLYHYLRLYVNYFQPSMRLASKERQGSYVKKTYSPAETPYRKLLASTHLTTKQKQKMRKEYLLLNPAELQRRLAALQEKLLKTINTTRRKIVPPRSAHPWQKPFIRVENQRHLE